MNRLRPVPHVAQQSRREKLRVQHSPFPPPAHRQFPGSSTRNSDPIPDLAQVRDAYDPASAMLDLSARAHNLPLAGAEASMIGPLPSGFHEASSSLARAGDPPSPCLWRGQPNCDWIVPSFVAAGSGAPAMITNPLVSPSVCHPKPGFLGCRDASSELSNQETHQQQYGDLHFPSSQLYHHTLQEVVTSSSSTAGNHGHELASIVQASSVREPGQPCSWVDSGNELLLLPSYGEQPNAVWVSRPPAQWNAEGGFARGKVVAEGFDTVGSEGGTQGLSLSLNPVADLPVAQLGGERFGLPNEAGNSCPHPKFSICDRAYGVPLQGIVSSSVDARRGAGPLGPFTGYATILKSSKFLKPAQQLLDEFCTAVTGPKLLEHRDEGGRSCQVGSGEKENGGRGGNPAVSSSSPNGSMEGVGGEAGASGEASQIHHPEIQQKKAKLLYMLEEVCRRYKQYHQQVQMVVSSFESVAGLSSATPYASLALKTVSKHFRCIRNAISDQLRHISKGLGEEFMSSPTSSRGETMTTPKFKHINQSLPEQKAGENSLGFMGQNQPVWRPQRGLPERAVAVLRAWLFDHFLHPYPTDTDKHMLATQTGLSRNQVSNWFINARVRLWKPMVEEIHMLETKGMKGVDLNSGNRNDANKPPIDDAGRSSNGPRPETECNKPLHCCSLMEPLMNDEGSQSMEQWHCEKRSRMDECGMQTSIDGNLISFGTYQSAMDIGGLGAVSLTLGLRQEGGQQQQQQQQQMRHFGSQIMRDFVG